MIPGDQINGDTLIRFFAKLKGRPCTPAEIKSFNEFGKKWQKDIKALRAKENAETPQQE
jgi:hypothetical protein